MTIRYRGSPLSVGKLGRVHGGDRLPWVGLDGSSSPTDNFAVLDGLYLVLPDGHVALVDSGKSPAASGTRLRIGPIETIMPVVDAKPVLVDCADA